MRLPSLLVVCAASEVVVLDLIVDSAHAAARANLLTSQQFHDAIAAECRLRSPSRSAWSPRRLGKGATLEAAFIHPQGRETSEHHKIVVDKPGTLEFTVTASNPRVVFGDAFVVVVIVRLTECDAAAPRCRLRVSHTVKWTKAATPPMLVRRAIERAARGGVKDKWARVASRLANPPGTRTTKAGWPK